MGTSLRWRALRFIPATRARVVEADEIMARLRRASIDAMRQDGLTTRGSRVVKIYVNQQQYARAVEVTRDLLPARPQEVIDRA